MNYLKVILAALGLFLAAMLLFSVIGIVYSALWYLFLLGVVAIAGTVGYQLLKKEEPKRRLEDKTPIAIADLTDADRTLEEYKRKYLSE